MEMYNNTLDTVTMAKLEREENGPWEIELTYGGEADLHEHCQGCEKNPGHLKFVSLDKFNVEHLPPGYRDDTLVEIVRAISDLTVRVSVKHVSDKRPETFPGTNKPYPFYRNRRSNLMRVGTGMIVSIVKYPREVDPDCASYCKECSSSENQTRYFARIEIRTAVHVVFDGQEAAHTTCHLFFDKDGTPDVCEGVVKLSEFTMGVSDVETDVCTLEYVTHDMELVDMLWKKFRFPSYSRPNSSSSPFPFPFPDFLGYHDGDSTKKHGSIQCLANMVILNLTVIIIQRLEERLTQKQFDVRIKILHDHMIGRLKYKDDVQSIEVERLTADLMQIFEDVYADKIHEMANSLTRTQIMKNIMTEALTHERMSSLEDNIAHSLAGFLTDRLAEIIGEQRGDLTQKLTNIVKQRLNESLEERLSDTKINTLIDTAHKLIDNVTQSLLDGLIKRLIKSLTQGLTNRLASTVKDVLNSSKYTMIGNHQQQKSTDTEHEQMKRMINDMYHLLINTLTQTDSPHATNSNKVTEREILKMTEHFLTGLTIIVSHPHGCSKQVSVGFCTHRWDQSDRFKDYMYTTATCPGSSGAALLVYFSDLYARFYESFSRLLHSGNVDENNENLKNLNFSCGMQIVAEKEEKKVTEEVKKKDFEV